MANPTSPPEQDSGLVAESSESTPLLPAGEQTDSNQLEQQSLVWRAGREAWHALDASLRCSHTNVLLICVPLGLYAGEWGWPPAAIFALNFLAMLPLASVLTFATEQLAAVVGSIAGGLINASFGNLVEMIVGISALKEGEIGIVQSSMIGSILSSTLLILGVSFFLGDLENGKAPVEISVDVAGILTSLMIISCSYLIMPSALHITDPNAGDLNNDPTDYVLTLSRITSIFLLIFYLLYLYFQSVSHAHLFNEEEDEPEDKLHWVASSVVLIVATLGVGGCSDALVDSIDGFVETLGVSRSFIGMILVPVVGNAGCFVGAVQWSSTGRTNLAVSVIVGSTLQISLFVTPFLVVVGWIIGKNMSLKFDTFETIVMTMSTLVLNCLVRSGKINYFEGLLLIGAYLIIAIAFFVRPDEIMTST